MMNIQPKIIYSPKYDIRFFGIEKLHPFDSCKYSRVWKTLIAEFGYQLLKKITTQPQKTASKSELLTVHNDYYLNLLKSSQYVAQALELLPLAIVPNWIQNKFVLTPMLWATKGTIIAAEEALKSGIAINLSGGYHHASQERGEGFCIYSDIAISIALLQKSNKIKKGEKVIIIDLDAHQGNGLERIFYDDPDVLIFDMYNQDIYPQDTLAREGINYDIPLHLGTQDDQYLGLLKEKLPSFLNEASEAKIAFYNAGTDIYKSDLLGGLKISAKGVLERDKFVFKNLTEANIPWVMVLSGGYTQQSYKLIANSISYLFHIFI
ncbi:MAG: histone deacetylase [Okeania sp. SIO3I5]|uniref:histone deacetylase family protein n=1 Tax=Okeania sp. SIO3I5 TaxID=2607805 RepID=UPI0013BB0D8F|nr:histone deacetylase [Okeania sp. SIO3I5]NEQ35191.1 histone deacetylase [Okeania sp. SIO3I5]